jgi:hypothetical protein
MRSCHRLPYQFRSLQLETSALLLNIYRGDVAFSIDASTRSSSQCSSVCSTFCSQRCADCQAAHAAKFCACAVALRHTLLALHFIMQAATLLLPLLTIYVTHAYLVAYAVANCQLSQIALQSYCDAHVDSTLNMHCC